MYFAELSHNYGYGFVTSVTHNTISFSEEFNDRVLTFDSEQVAKDYFKSFDWLNTVNIVSFADYESIGA